MEKDFLSPKEIANLRGLKERYVKLEIKRMREIGLWNDSIIMQVRTYWTTKDAFLSYQNWKVTGGKNGQG